MFVLAQAILAKRIILRQEIVSKRQMKWLLGSMTAAFLLAFLLAVWQLTAKVVLVCHLLLLLVREHENPC